MKASCDGDKKWHAIGGEGLRQATTDRGKLRSSCDGDLGGQRKKLLNWTARISVAEKELLRAAIISAFALHSYTQIGWRKKQLASFDQSSTTNDQTSRF